MQRAGKVVINSFPRVLPVIKMRGESLLTAE